MWFMIPIPFTLHIIILRHCSSVQPLFKESFLLVSIVYFAYRPRLSTVIAILLAKYYTRHYYPRRETLAT